MSIALHRHEEFAVMVLDRPETLNALSLNMLQDISSALDSLGRGDGIRALFVTGAGEKAFCAGADLRGIGTRSVAGQREGVALAQGTLHKFSTLQIPTVALINGHAIGGGLELALACTFRIAAQNARFSLPEIKLGLVPSYGGTQRLPRIVGETHALDIVMTGRSVDAEEALKIGLVSRVVPQAALLQTGVDFARRFTCHSLPVLEFVRRAVQEGCDTSLDKGFAIEAEYSARAHQTQDSKEGVAAFREKRKPSFKDQ
jgi:enoyl-CoA hydratase